MPQLTEVFCLHFPRFSDNLTVYILYVRSFHDKRVGLTCLLDFKQVGDLSVVVLLSLSFIC